MTLIEQEAIEQTSFQAKDTRRNIVVSNFPLNHLVGKQFVVGEVVMRGVELCHPCTRPDVLSGKVGFKEAFKNCGGLRGKVLNTGVIKVGDLVDEQ